MIEKAFGTINCTNEPNKDFYLYGKMYKYINKKFKKFYYINLSKIFYPHKKITKFSYPDNFKVIFPKNYKDLKNFLVNKDLYLFVSLGKKINNLYIYYLLKKYDVKLFLNFYIGYYKENNFFFKKNIIDNIIDIFNFFFIKKIPKIIFRLMLLLKMAPPYEAIFTGSNSEKNIYKNILKRGSNYLKLRPNFLNKVFKVNFRAYDDLIKKTKRQQEKYIVFLDSGFDHGDVIIQQGPHTEENRLKYYFLLRKILIQFQKLYNKKTIICLHPKTDEKIVKKYIKDIKLIKFQTQNYILKAQMVLFHESSAVLDAIFLKKKIVCLQSDIMGEYYNKRNKYYPTKAKMPSIRMENYEKIKKTEIEFFFKNRKKLYENFLKNFVTPNRNKFIANKKNKKNYGPRPGYEQIINIIEKNYKI